MLQWYLQCSIDGCDCEADFIMSGFSLCEGHAGVFRPKIYDTGSEKKEPMYCGKCYQYYEKNCWCVNNPAKKMTL